MPDHADALEIGCAMSVGDSLTVDVEGGPNGGMLALTVTEAEHSATMVLDDDGEAALLKLLADRSSFVLVDRNVAATMLEPHMLPGAVS